MEAGDSCSLRMVEGGGGPFGVRLFPIRLLTEDTTSQSCSGKVECAH